MRIGRRAAIDVGTKRIGLAACDRDGILASPITTILRKEDDSWLTELVEALPEDLLEIYVGLPTNLKSESTKSTVDSVVVATEIDNRAICPVLLIDERMTTALAHSQLRQIGRSQKQARSSIDQMAAVAILEYALEIEKKQDIRPGISIAEWKESHE